MRTLENHNKDVQAAYTYPKLNGVACPNCGEELYDRDGTVLCSNPPQRNIICLEEGCGYTGYRH